MTATFVYFLKPVGMGGPIKIGCSADPKTRVATLMGWSPFPLEIIGAVPGDFVHEARLLRQFRAHRLHGEWFSPAPELASFIADVCRDGRLPFHAPGIGGGRHDRLLGLPTILRRHRISRARFATQAGVHPATVGNWCGLRGSRSSAGRTLVALAELGVHCELPDLLTAAIRPAPSEAAPQREAV